jgi:hypothetical protein
MTSNNETVIYVYGYQKGSRKGSNRKPVEVASVYPDELAGTLAEAARLGYVGLWHQTTTLPCLSTRQGSNNVAIGRRV